MNQPISWFFIEFQKSVNVPHIVITSECLLTYNLLLSFNDFSFFFFFLIKGVEKSCCKLIREEMFSFLMRQVASYSFESKCPAKFWVGYNDTKFLKISGRFQYNPKKLKKIPQIVNTRIYVLPLVWLKLKFSTAFQKMGLS